MKPSPACRFPNAARAVLAVLALLALAPPARAQIRYPRLALPGAIHGTGVPYLDSLGTLNLSVIDAVARYDEVILDVSPVTEFHPEIVAALRARNPQIKLLGYVTGENIWDITGSDTLRHIPTLYNHMIRDLGGFLYDRKGNHYGEYDINIAKRDAGGNYVVAEAIANFFHDKVVASGLWDGMFVDVYCDVISWSQAPTESIDVSRTGYPDLPSLDVGWRAGSDTLASRLRALCGPDFILVGNCALGTKYGWFNGWTRENFPFQEGGSWYTNMFWDPGGYFVDEQRFRQPTQNVVFSPVTAPGEYSSYNTRRVRLGLGSASLGTGLATFGPFDRSLQDPPHETWWYDEYSVDVTTGNATSDRAHTGWLGQASGPPYQMVWVGSNPDAASNPDFETSVSDGWKFVAQGTASATVERDTTSSASGHASCHIAIAAAGLHPWDVNIATLGGAPLTAYTQSSATFWARASAPRVLTVVAIPQSGQGVEQNVSIDTDWKRYQVVITPLVTSSTVLDFFVGLQAGDVWLDDVHLQSGVTSIWRRDFEHGTVLVNPSIYTLQVPMTGSWRHIRGVADPLINDGSVVTTATIAPSDATFLIGAGTDKTPPNAVRDARITP